MKFLSILILLTIPLLLIPGIIPDSYAEGRDEIKRAEKHIEIIEKRIEKLQIKVTEQREEIKKNEDTLESDKINLKNLKKSTNTSWTHLEKIIKAKDKIEESKKIVINSKPKLIELLTLINSQENSIKSFEDKIKEIEIINKKTIIDPNELLKKDESKPDTFDVSGYVKKIGIKLANICTTALKNNVTNPCGITYEDLITLDSSNTDISGDFITDNDGFFHRRIPQVNNDCRAYDTDNQLRIFVDPSSHCQTRIKIIEILPNFETYTLNGLRYQNEEFEYVDFIVNSTFGNVTQSKIIQIQNSTNTPGQILFHDRFIDESCKKAMINSEMWKILIPDTLRHMRQNCLPGTTNYDIKEFIPANNTDYNRNNSPAWKELERFEDSKIKCKLLCFEY